MMKKIFLAFQFLTIIPFKNSEVTEREIGTTTAFFPLVGLAEGGVVAIMAMLLIKILPSEVVNALVVLLLIIINGGLHLDGLADTFDAIASRGDREKKLSVMKDSVTGPIGVIAIVMALLINYALLNAVFLYASGILYYEILLIMPVATRWAMVAAIYYSKSARNDGLGRIFIKYTSAREFIMATVMSFVFVFLISLSFSDISLFIFFCILIFPVIYAGSVMAVWFLKRQFDGLTGDSFGAVNEAQRLLFLITTVVWLQQSIS